MLLKTICHNNSDVNGKTHETVEKFPGTRC